MKGRGHGKLILAGEHAVVYGYPALACAVSRGTQVQLCRVAGETFIEARGLDTEQRAQLHSAFSQVIEDTGWQITIQSDLPIGRGMGSSAALAVALVRARFPGLSPEEVVERAMPVETVFHGNPSGLDVACAAHGGTLSFRKGPPKSWQSHRPLRGHIVVLDTMIAGCTADLVAHVASQRPTIEPTLARMGALAEQAMNLLDDPQSLGELMNENHHLLASVGVSTPETDRLVRLARRAGAHGAKLSGAGGGGIVIALCDDPQQILAAAHREGVPALTCTPVSGVSP